MSIQMVDLKGRYQKIKPEVDAAVLEVIDPRRTISGPAVSRFRRRSNRTSACGTSSLVRMARTHLQIAMMALRLEPGDEVIVPSFTFLATAEDDPLLRRRDGGRRCRDVQPDARGVTGDAITPRTKAVVPVHLFSQSCEMQPILDIAAKHGIAVIRGRGSIHQRRPHLAGRTGKRPAIGRISCTSFFPSKVSAAMATAVRYSRMTTNSRRNDAFDREPRPGRALLSRTRQRELAA
ncbi:MAG: DegT/DnrJ/EryC1/StrS family aminotransferase [Pyrinomonadaceae bacterium]